MAQPFVPEEALVKFKPSVSRERIDAILKESGTELITEIKGSGVDHVRIVDKESVVKKLSAFQAVEYAEPNYLYQVSMIPHDPQFTSLWELQNTRQPVIGTVGTRRDRSPLLVNIGQSASPHRPSRHRFTTHEVTHEN